MKCNLIILLLSVLMSLFPGMTEARWRGEVGYGGWGPGPGYDRGYEYDRAYYPVSSAAGCRWAQGHYDEYGDWIPGHQVCWRN